MTKAVGSTQTMACDHRFRRSLGKGRQRFARAQLHARQNQIGIGLRKNIFFFTLQTRFQLKLTLDHAVYHQFQTVDVCMTHWIRMIPDADGS